MLKEERRAPAEYFHELTEDQVAHLMALPISWEQVSAILKQPPWCDYPEAVSPLGCWSLIAGWVTGPLYCDGCDMKKESGSYRD